MSKKINFKEIAMKAGGAAAGGAGSVLLNKVVPNLDLKLRAGAKIVIGAVIPELFPKMKILDAVGMGMIGAGAAELTQEFIPATPPVNGIADEQFAEDKFVVDPEIHGTGEEHLSDNVQDVINGPDGYNVVVE